MKDITYLAVFEPGEEGTYGVFFPDLPGCISCGDNLTHAQRMAVEAASLHVYGLEQDGAEVPTPSVRLSRDDTEGNIVMPVMIHPDLYRLKKDSERVKTNVTLPHGLSGQQKKRTSTSHDFLKQPCWNTFSFRRPIESGTDQRVLAAPRVSNDQRFS